MLKSFSAGVSCSGRFLGLPGPPWQAVKYSAGRDPPHPEHRPTQASVRGLRKLGYAPRLEGWTAGAHGARRAKTRSSSRGSENCWATTNLRPSLRLLAAPIAPELLRKARSTTEGAGNAGCQPHPQPRVRNKKAHEHSHRRSSRIHPAFPTQWFTAYIALC